MIILILILILIMIIVVITPTKRASVRTARHVPSPAFEPFGALKATAPPPHPHRTAFPLGSHAELGMMPQSLDPGAPGSSQEA